MKTLLIIDANLGQARAYMAKTLLGAAARKAKLEIIDNPNDAEMAIVLGDSIPNDSALNGKNVWLGDISRAVARSQRPCETLHCAGRCDSTGCRQRSETRSCGDCLPDWRSTHLYGG